MNLERHEAGDSRNPETNLYVKYSISTYFLDLLTSRYVDADTLVDDKTVLGRESVQGMGDVNVRVYLLKTFLYLFCIQVYWYTHFYAEGVDEVHSRVNENEAEMIVHFAEYLALNELDPDEITILTFYAGQRNMILQKLRANKNLTAANIKVRTVDSYQGEENTVILLSLVRSNDRGQIGFLDVLLIPFFSQLYKWLTLFRSKIVFASPYHVPGTASTSLEMLQ